MDMEELGHAREKYFREFLELSSGIPDSDTFRRLFESLNSQELSHCLLDWRSVERVNRSVVALDGKSICCSANEHHKVYHVVSAFH